jgi:hypothetical protein
MSPTSVTLIAEEAMGNQANSNVKKEGIDSEANGIVSGNESGLDAVELLEEHLDLVGGGFIGPGYLRFPR